MYISPMCVDTRNVYTKDSWEENKNNGTKQLLKDIIQENIPEL